MTERSAPANGHRAGPELAAAMFVAPADADHLVESVHAMRLLGVPLLVGSSSPSVLARYGELGCETVEAFDPAQTINQAWGRHRTHLLAIGDAVAVPKSLATGCLERLASDVRVASVSFFSNDAAYLSFPERNEPRGRLPSGHDAESLSRLLKERGPRLAPVPVLLAAGPVVVLSAPALGAVGALEAGPRRSFGAVIADFSARARDRGFVHLLDDTAFVGRRRSPIAEPVTTWPIDDLVPADRHWFSLRHLKDLPALHVEMELETSPVAIAHHVARAKALGLRVAVDGYDLGPHETGTQTGLLASVEALAKLPEIERIVVVLSGEAPGYARRYLSDPKVRPVVAQPDELGDLEHCDLVHRMAQPNPGFEVPLWRKLGDRVVTSILDLIAYRVGAYHADHEDWLNYRAVIRRNVGAVDAVTVISHDVRAQVECERLPIEADRLEVIPFGTEHLSGQERLEIPTELAARGLETAPFVLCLGTDYSHKNRDLAIATLGELRRRGWSHAMVLAGPAVPHGSSRRSETWALLRDHLDPDSVLLLPEVPSAERNWLLKHAQVLLYPSGAEGFGLIPYEAASFGTPTVFVGFGPLRELAPDLPVMAADWSPGALADATERLLADAGLARTQVAACTSAAGAYSWQSTAERLRDLYYRVLAMPVRSP